MAVDVPPVPTAYQASQVLGWLVAGLGAIVLAAYVFDIGVLKTLAPTAVPMKANTALGMLVCGVTVALRSRPRADGSGHPGTAALASFVLVLGAASLAEYLTGADLGIDTLLLPDASPSPIGGPAHPGRMSPVTGLCFVWVASALLVLHRPIRVSVRLPVVTGVGATVTAIGALALFGYASEALFGYHVWNYTGVAIHTATGFALLGIALLALAHGESPLAWSLDPLISVGFLSGIVLVVVMAGFSYDLIRGLVDASARVSHTQEVQKEIQALRVDLADLEAAQHSVSNLSEGAVDRLEETRSRLLKRVAAVKGLTTDNERQQGRIDRVADALLPNAAWAPRLVEERPPEGSGPRASVAADPESVARDDLRGALTAMEEEEGALLVERKARSTTAVRDTFSFLPVGVLVAVSMLTVGLSLLNAGVGAQAKSQRAVTDNQSRFEGIVNSAMDAIITVDREQRVVLFNTAAERMFRCTTQDAVGQSIEAFIPARYRASHSRHIEEFGATGVTSRSMGLLGTISGLRSDGEEFPIEASISQTEVAGQKLYTVILRDVTERMAAQEALARQGRLFDQSYDAILAWGWEGPITFWNRGAERLYGVPRSRALGRRSQEVFETTVAGGLERLLARLEKDGFWEGALEHRTADGRRITVESRMVLVREGERSYVLETNRDVTERRRAEEEVRELNADLERRVAQRTVELESANRELEAFSYSVSHDLRSPLRTVDGFSQALLEDFGGLLPDEGKRQVLVIREGAQRMGQLIDDLLAFSRLGRLAMGSHQPLDMERLVRDTLDELLRQRGGKAVAIRIGHLPPGDGDHALVKQVWTNLLSNALKYSGKCAEPVVEIGAEVRGGVTVYFVKDNGVGFDMRYAKKLFGVFQRLHRAEDFEGTGVGLAIVQRIVQRHGGRVWAEAAPNQGAIFRFTLQGGLAT